MAVHMRKHPGQLTVVIKLVETACSLRAAGHHVVIVSSGAIGVGLRRMNLARRPKHLPQVQALAAIGQSRLMSLWDQLFGNLEQPIAQVLLTRNDIADRTQYQNAQNTFIELLSMGVIPIVNENDTLAVTEIKFGDNDTLSAITAGMVQADYLFLMTDVDCLYDKNPRSNPDAKSIPVVEDIAELAADVSSAGSSLGTGGMSTKIVAARLATSAGVTTVITKSSKPGQQQLTRASSPQTEDPCPLHTRFLPISNPIRDRYFWILHGLAPHGTIYIDQGAWAALSDKAGLLPAGIVDVDGHFAQQEAVRIVVVKRLSSSSSKSAQSQTPASPSQIPTTPGAAAHAVHAPIPIRHPLTPSASSSHIHQLSSPHQPPAFELHNPAPFEIGRAVVNYSATEIRRIKGLHSTQIREALGYADSEYIALRENIAFFGGERSRPSTPDFRHGAEKKVEGGEAH
ncbi:Aspartate/glutamate/uridylate kinase [Bipolaris maydis]|nr:Aspartate/glutamate/uridylate kinase [Bipolaris maydis]